MLIVKYANCWKCQFFKDYDNIMICSLKEYERVYHKKYDKKIKCDLL